MINKILDSNISNLTFNNFCENKITKIVDKLIKKKEERSPLIKINTSDKIKIRINGKNKKLSFFKRNIDKPKNSGHSLLT